MKRGKGGEWTNTTLGSITDFLSGGTPAKDRADYWGGSIPWVSAKDMKSFRLEDTEDHLTNEGVHNGTRLVPSGTVLLLASGMTLLNDSNLRCKSFRHLQPRCQSTAPQIRCSTGLPAIFGSWK